MSRTSFLIGISAIAFAAGAAQAQTTTTTNGDTTDANGNRVVVSCTTGSSCSVTQGAVGTTFNSTGSANAYGANNISEVRQEGNNLFAENVAGSVGSPTSNRNEAYTYQRGFSNSGSISQTGSATGATTGLSNTYGGNAASNYGVVQQGVYGVNHNDTANNDVARIVQVRTAGAANSAGGNDSRIFQNDDSQIGGGRNRATSTQNGTGLYSEIEQSDYYGGSGIAASNNSATVVQIGRGGTATTGSRSFVDQQRSGNVANVALYDGGNTTNGQGGQAWNQSDVRQTNTIFNAGATSGTFVVAGGPNPAQSTANSPNTGNLATVSITGVQNSSSVTQNGVQNTVDVSMLTGGLGNTSDPTASGTNPGTGGAYPAGRAEGNSSTISQTGRGNYAAVSLGGQVTTGGGKGNISSITQSQPDATVAQTTLNSAQLAAAGHKALAYQRGILDIVTITQSNNALGGGGPGTATQSGSVADVSQLSFNSTTSVTQTGTNFARVTQGQRNEATNANNSATITQTDAGDLPTSGSAGGGFGGGSSGGFSATRNYVDIAQYGIQNDTIVEQNAINASASVFQASGTRAFSNRVRQGVGSTAAAVSTEQVNAANAAANTGSNAQNLTATVNQTAGNGGGGFLIINQNGQNLTATANQQGGVAAAGTATNTPGNNQLTISQAYKFNSATVTQAGTSLTAIVEQRGSGSATLQNLVTINQSNSGTTLNRALAVQTQNVGASTSTGATAGVINDVNFPNSRTGANSAEIVILQSGTGGSATVEQRGKGQYASLTQGGTGNTGGILQDTGATNAVALLTQTGTNNIYYITQTTAGQYIRVNQSGTGNVGTSSIVNGPSGPGQTNAATPQTAPTFGGTP